MYYRAGGSHYPGRVFQHGVLPGGLSVEEQVA